MYPVLSRRQVRRSELSTFIISFRVRESELRTQTPFASYLVFKERIEIGDTGSTGFLNSRQLSNQNIFEVFSDAVLTAPEWAKKVEGRPPLANFQAKNLHRTRELLVHSAKCLARRNRSSQIRLRSRQTAFLRNENSSQNWAEKVGSRCLRPLKKPSHTLKSGLGNERVKRIEHRNCGMKLNGILEMLCLVEPRSAKADQVRSGSWWRQQGSNLRPSECKSDALPAELCPQQTERVASHLKPRAVKHSS